jgi:hypothetical protein
MPSQAASVTGRGSHTVDFRVPCNRVAVYMAICVYDSEGDQKGQYERAKWGLVGGF